MSDPISAAAEAGSRIAANVEQVIVGKHAEVELILVALFCRGHVLIEDVPGTGKTALARALARSLDAGFRRIQFTPDMLPSDLTGLSVWNQAGGGWDFHPGPLLTQVLLADEINRATPKTQSALLEAMEERQVTIDGISHPMPEPFLVIATQNPVESEGTFLLPEAQLDRFMIRTAIGYPSALEERRILRQNGSAGLEALAPVLSAAELTALAALIGEHVHVADEVADYIIRIVRATREHPEITLGASPRASLALYRAAQARAALDERDFVLPDDVKRLVPAVLAHRLILRPAALVRGVTAADLLASLVAATPLDHAGGDGLDSIGSRIAAALGR